ncbi:hypothetical protein CRG98_049338 [Punica granatum]|uniref:Uncharacterized protein n=1 Tax=Punica granatum TaxID=22663 RepID=A0A2I0HEZ8_PUNGR|nr:hypothetical protein CRG98_049338 [Punica granatum]
MALVTGADGAGDGHGRAGDGHGRAGWSRACWMTGTGVLDDGRSMTDAGCACGLRSVTLGDGRWGAR